LPTEGKVLAHLRFNSNVLPGSIDELIGDIHRAPHKKKKTNIKVDI
jgi:hypothetical protein